MIIKNILMIKIYFINNKKQDEKVANKKELKVMLTRMYQM